MIASSSAPEVAFAAEPGLRVVAYGDSFSAGEGLPDIDPGETDCQRALGRTGQSTAWGVQVARRWSGGTDPVWFAACTGATTENWADEKQKVGGLAGIGGRQLPATQRDEALGGLGLVGKPANLDAITLTFGGNDIDFSGKIYDCLGLDREAVRPGPSVGGWLSGTFGRCSGDTNKIMRERIAVLGDPSNGLPSFYQRVAKDLAPGGTLVVAGYPQVLATVADWPAYARAARRCNGIHMDDADLLNGVNAYLNEVIAQAVSKAGELDRGHRYQWVDVTTDGGSFEPSNSLCGAGEDYLNGITLGFRGVGVIRLNRSFHPNQKGHDAFAASILNKVPEIVRGASFPDWSNFSYPAGLCGSDAGAMLMRGGKTSASTQNPSIEVPVGNLEDVAAGDVDGDGADEAVVTISCNRSGLAGGGARIASLWKATGPAQARLLIPDLGAAAAAGADPFADVTGGIDSGFVFDVEISGGTLTVTGGASGPGDLSGQPQSRWQAEVKLAGNRLERQSKTKVLRGESVEGLAGPFVFGIAHGLDVSAVASNEVADEAVRLGLPGTVLLSMSCYLEGDITSRCDIEGAPESGGRRTFVVYVQPDTPPGVEFNGEELVRNGKPYNPTIFNIVDVTT
jgi:lysophospholipase L1-like esterase